LVTVMSARLVLGRSGFVALLVAGLAAGSVAGPGFAANAEAGGSRAVRGLGAAERGDGWGKAQLVSGTGVGQSGITSVSCAAPGDCSAGGFESGQAMVVGQRNGVWGQAEVVPGTFQLNTTGQAEVTSVSCASPGNCSAGGTYSTVGYVYASPQQAFVVSERNGVWGEAEEIPGLAALNTGGNAQVNSVSCGAAGDCVVGGQYSSGSETGNAGAVPFVAVQEHGRWGKAEQLPGLTNGAGEVYSVSCGAKGNCVAGGYFGRNHVRSLLDAFVAVLKDGRWARALPIRMGEVSAVSCASAGNCTAAGGGLPGGALAVSQRHGRWGKVEEIPGQARNTFSIESVSCAAPGDCATGGTGGIVAVQHHGVWGKAEQVPGLAALDRGNFTWVMSVSCGSVGDCSAGGFYSSRLGAGLSAFVTVEHHGVWGNAEPVPGLAALSNHEPTGQINSVSCASAGHCSAGGITAGGPNIAGHAFVVSQRARRRRTRAPGR
jgi:hypothetical protein